MSTLTERLTIKQPTTTFLERLGPLQAVMHALRATPPSSVFLAPFALPTYFQILRESRTLADIEYLDEWARRRNPLYNLCRPDIKTLQSNLVNDFYCTF